MRTVQNRAQEISTITERMIPLKLSTADVDRLAEKAAGVGLTPAELLENFIGDLVGGTRSNGSDERYYANYWMERCGFEHTTRKSFLRYLSNIGDPSAVIDTWHDHLTGKDIFEDDAEDITPEDRSSAKAAMDECLEDIKASYNEYRAWAGGEAASLEEEMTELLSWKRSLDCLKQTEQPQAQSDALTAHELNNLHGAFAERAPGDKPPGLEPERVAEDAGLEL